MKICHRGPVRTESFLRSYKRWLGVNPLKEQWGLTRTAQAEGVLQMCTVWAHVPSS